MDSETGRDARDPEINIYCNDGGWRIIGRQNYYQTFGGVQGEVPPENGWERYHCGAPFPTLSFYAQSQARTTPGSDALRSQARPQSSEEDDVDGDDVGLPMAENAVNPADALRGQLKALLQNLLTMLIHG